MTKLYSAAERHPDDAGRVLFVPLYTGGILSVNEHLEFGWQLAYWFYIEGKVHIRYRDGKSSMTTMTIHDMSDRLHDQVIVAVNP